MNSNKLLIQNAIIIDGTGSKGFKGDILLQDGKIQHIAENIPLTGGEEVLACAPGHVVTPGFVDTHSHGDFVMFHDPAQKVKLFQGVTTEIEGNCGISAAPVNPKYADELIASSSFLANGKAVSRETILEWCTVTDYINAVEKLEMGINSGFLAGHNTIRLAVMGMESRKPTAQELDSMKAILAECFEQGAFGMSTGLIYPPGVFADADELAALCEVVRQYDGVYSTHMRNESFRLSQSVQESIDIGRRTGCKVHISHHKVSAKEKWGEVAETLRMIDEANKEGIRVTADVYPYTAACTTLSSMIPPAFHEGGAASMVERLKQAGIRKEISDIIFSDDTSWDNMYREAGFENILVISGDKTPDAVGKTLTEYAALASLSEIDALFHILITNEGDAMCVEFCLSEQDVETVLKHPRVMVGSDSTAAYPGLSFHPRTTGTFPRVLGRYVRERGVLTLEEAVRKMTSLPADTFGIKNKGRVQAGYDADLVIFNPDTVIDKSDYTNPEQAPEGIEAVILGGQIAVHRNEYKPNAKGCIVRKQQN